MEIHSNIITSLLSSVAARKQDRAILVAVSGIDGSGKSKWTEKLSCELVRRGLNVALIGIDPWHQPRTIRFNTETPGEHFYMNAYRWNELFSQLVLPLKSFRNIYLPVNLYRIEHDVPYQHTYFLRNIDVILLEGIFLLKKEFRSHYNFTVWINCSFETALDRALERNQEGLDEAGIIKEYKNIYFPAQEFHIKNDAPVLHADLVIENEWKTEERPGAIHT